MQMLDQAVLDAKSLKEAAMKNAENQLLEKYAPQIKEAVDALLEQGDEEDPLDDFIPDDESSTLTPEAPLEIDIKPEDQSVIDGLPSAATGGENLCPCPDDDDIVEIDLNDVMPDAEEDGSSPSDISDRDSLAQNISSELGDEEEEDKFQISESELMDIVREAMMEYENVPTGSPATNSSDMEEMDEIEQLKSDLGDKEEENSTLKENIKNLKNNETRYKRIILELKDRFDEMNLVNSRLLYSNRVLSDVSLNERQKKELVESIETATTIEQAKMIFETLKKTMGSKQKPTAPKTLQESVERRSSGGYQPRRTKQSENSSPEFDRMRRLAGIKQTRES